jgi:RNA polymerase subunit RPABC4/transcription elongation factor Spt4
MPQLPDLSGLGRLLELFIAFLGAYLFAIWVSMIIWTIRDIRSRSRDIFAQLLAVALVVVFNVPGLLLYFILRPREPLTDKYERELAEEAMLQDIEERQVCPVCHHKVTAEYLVCPNCHTKLHKKCDHCGRVLNLKWGVCPFCGEPQTLPGAPRPVGEQAPRPPLPPVREHVREISGPRESEPMHVHEISGPRESEPVSTPVTPKSEREHGAVMFPSIESEIKAEPPPDGKLQATGSPARLPATDPLSPLEPSP